MSPRQRIIPVVGSLMHFGHERGGWSGTDSGKNLLMILQSLEKYVDQRLYPGEEASSPKKCNSCLRFAAGRGGEGSTGGCLGRCHPDQGWDWLINRLRQHPPLPISYLEQAVRGTRREQKGAAQIRRVYEDNLH